MRISIGIFDTEMYMKVPEGLTLTRSNIFQTSELALNSAKALTLQFKAIQKNVV